MEIIKKLIARLFGVERSVEKIISPLTKIIDDLESHAQEQVEKAEAEIARKLDLEKLIADRQAEVARAKAAAGNVKNFVGAL